MVTKVGDGKMSYLVNLVFFFNVSWLIILEDCLVLRNREGGGTLTGVGRGILLRYSSFSALLN